MNELRIGSIVIDCRDFEQMKNFWQHVLHYVPLYPAAGGWVILADPAGRGPNVSINQAPEVENHKNRLHLDLYAGDQKAEVNRLVALGAKLHRGPEPGEDFVVLEDPGGNLFCVVDAKGR